MSLKESRDLSYVFLLHKQGEFMPRHIGHPEPGVSDDDWSAAEFHGLEEAHGGGPHAARAEDEKRVERVLNESTVKSFARGRIHSHGRDAAGGAKDGLGVLEFK
jgi:hypothetical protein